MKRWLRRAAWVLLALALAIAAAAAYLRWAFDANSLKPRIASWMQSKYQRQLTIAGDIQLKLWPSARLELGAVTLSAPNHAAPFATLQRGSASVRLRPLLRREVVVEALNLEGLTLNLQRFADGRWNFDDLLRSEAGSNLKVDIAALVLRDATVNVHDAASGERWQASKLQLSAGAIALDKPGELTGSFELAQSGERVRMTVALTTAFLARAQPFALELNRFEAQASGRVNGLTLEQLRLTGSLAARANNDWQARELRLSARALRGQERIALQASMPQLASTAGALSVSGAQARATREVGAAKHEVNVTLDTLQGRDGEFAVPAGKLEFAAHDAFGDWTGSLRGEVGYRQAGGELRLNKAQFEARWLRNAAAPPSASAGAAATQAAELPLRLFGTGELFAQPAQGVWRATEVAFELRGPSPAGELDASGRLRADAALREPRVALEADALRLELKKDALRVQASSTKAVSMQWSGTAVSAALESLQLRVQGADLDLTGSADLGIASANAPASYALKPLALRLTGKRAGAQIKVEARAEAQGSIGDQRFSAPNARLQLESRGSKGTTRAALRGTLTVDGKSRRLRLVAADTSLSVNPLLRIHQGYKLNLNGVLDWDWAKPAAAFAGRARLDESNIEGRVAWTGAAQTAYNFDLSIDTLDWDRYLANSAKSAPKQKAAGAGALALDLGQLRALHASGVARVGVLKASGVTAKNVTLEVQ